VGEFRNGMVGRSRADVVRCDGWRTRFCARRCRRPSDQYQGHSYARLYVEEIGTFPSPAPIFKLMATLRSSAGVPVGFLQTWPASARTLLASLVADRSQEWQAAR
jgi:hypothetical protein